MNIPRQFYGMNYLSRLFNNFQDTEHTEYPKLCFHELNDINYLPLEQRNTFSLGLNANCLSKLLKELATSRLCALDGFACARGEKLLFADYRPPYSEENPHITNSTCKTVTAIAVMFAVSEGLLSEEDTVLSFFPEYENLLTPKYVKQMTVRHLLTMTTGSKTSEVTSVVENDWVKAFLLTDCQYEPGTKFIYNSMNSYMLAAILTRVTGMSLMDYLKERFFEPLGINHVKWELCPQGIERGGWGLHISLEGMLKIGIFLMNNGKFHGKQLIDPAYIKRLKETKVVQEADSLSVGYGYQLWHLPKGRYMLSGMYGQHVIIDEKKKLVFATNAHGDRMSPDSQLTRAILSCMDDRMLFKPKNRFLEEISYRKFMQEFKTFTEGCYTKDFLTGKLTVKKFYKQQREKVMELLTQFDGKRLHINQATIKLFPYILQGMYQYPPFHVTDIAFKVQEDTLKLCFYKERSKKNKNDTRDSLILEAGYGSYHVQTVSFGEDKKDVALKVYPSIDEDGRSVLMLDIVFTAEGFSRLIKFFIMDYDKLGIESQEFPDLRTISEHVIYGDTVIAGNTIDLTNKLPESVRVFLSHKVEPRVNGYFVE